MANIYLSLGSNIDKERNISSALDCLEEVFGDLELSKVYESEAVGFKGDSFLNLVVGIESNLELEELSPLLKRIEDEHQRDRTGPKFSGRTLDIDIVVYKEKVGTYYHIELPRPELFYNAFVLLPMSDLVGDRIEPKSGNTYQQLWDNFSHDQKLWPVNFSWQGRLISMSG